MGPYTIWITEHLHLYNQLDRYLFKINTLTTINKGHFSGLIFTLTVLSRYLGISDPMLGIIGSLSLFFCSFCRAFSFQLGAWMLYVGNFYGYFLTVVLCLMNFTF